MKQTIWSRTASLAAFVLLNGWCLGLRAQSPEVSSAPLTDEQVAVYQAFLSQNRKDDSTWLNLSRQTFILQPDDGDYMGCMRGFEPSQLATRIRQFSEAFASGNHIHLVNPKEFKARDPMKAMMEGESAESAVQRAFENGLFTVSEIIFDSKRHRAAFRYGFSCGDLCGRGETVVYEKHHGKWIPAKQSCGYGIS